MTEAVKRRRRPRQRVGQGESAWHLTWRRFRNHRLALLGGTVILVLVLGAVLAPWISPYEYSRTNLRRQFAAPTFTVPTDAQLLGRCTRPAVLFWKCGMHPFGTDDLGRDILTRVLYGGRVSLLVGFAAGLASTLLGGLLGATVAYFGGRMDALVSRFTDTMLSIPQFPLLLILTGVLASREVPLAVALSNALGGAKSIVVIIVVITALSWMGAFRLVRGEVLSLRERTFVEAARAIGASRRRIIFRYLLPNTAHVMIVQATLMVGEAILIESGLSFLGLGIQPPAVSWGNMLSRAQEFLYYPNGVYVALFPGAFIFLTVLCFNFVGDGLRDALDPRFGHRV
ncbi:MAG: ABC transporter permease, partial [Candidatus Acetothermia bacterium]|nr:ABC transporter permease [Candidatus Acetothermia bacterium]